MMGASAVLKLQKVGFSAEQVEALADFMDTQVASKADVEGVEHRLGARLQEVKTELEAVEHRLESRILEAKNDLLKTIIAVMVVNSAVILAAMFGLAKLLGH
jgi:DNA-binding transcriptional MerR regulator